jgi:putative membrane protein
MTARWLAASFHLLALGIGLGAVWARGRALRSSLDPGTLRQVFFADSLWGLAALLWISTGLWRLLAGLEKGTGYYLQNHLFLTKMALLALVLLLEIRPMITLIRWRKTVSRGEAPDTRAAPLLARISFAQAWLIVLMVFAATGMARGMGM